MKYNNGEKKKQNPPAPQADDLAVVPLRLDISDPAVAAAAETARARVLARYAIAQRFPRNADHARELILNACKRPAFAEKVEFAKPVGGKEIRGASIRFAELALKEWGNIDDETSVMTDDDAARRIKVTVTELQTNVTHAREIVVKKTVERKFPSPDRVVIGERVNVKGEKVYILEATEDEMWNKENALISKAIRNEGLRLIPTDIVDEAVDAARETLKSRDAQDPNAAKKKLLDAFFEIGISPKDIEAYLGHPTAQMVPLEMERLRTVYRAIRDGEAMWSEYVKKEPVEERPHAVETPIGDIKATFDHVKPPIDDELLQKEANAKAIAHFDKLAKGLLDPAGLESFLRITAAENDCTVSKVKIEASEDFVMFESEYRKFMAEQERRRKAGLTLATNNHARRDAPQISIPDKIPLGAEEEGDDAPDAFVPEPEEEEEGETVAPPPRRARPGEKAKPDLDINGMRKDYKSIVTSWKGIISGYRDGGLLMKWFADAKKQAKEMKMPEKMIGELVNEVNEKLRTLKR